jgi:hypothetical protein
MLCEHQATVFSKPSGRARSVPRQVRCRRKARVLAGIPYGVNTMEYHYCEPCADKWVRDVFYARGKVVSVEPLADDPESVQPRDERGRFLPKAKASGHA